VLAIVLLFFASFFASQKAKKAIASPFLLLAKQNCFLLRKKQARQEIAFGTSFATQLPFSLRSSCVAKPQGLQLRCTKKGKGKSQLI
jgi:hypothetical protein